MVDKCPWSVWYAPVSFVEDDGRSKLRPVVVLGEEENQLCLVLSVTSKQKPEPYGYQLKHPDFAHLREGSTVLLHELRELDKSTFQRFVGKLHFEDIRNIQRLLTWNNLH